MKEEKKMGKLYMQIPRTKYGFISDEQYYSNETNRQLILEKYLTELDKYTVNEDESNNTQSPELIVVNKKCPVCQGNILEQIGISARTNKPYHKLRCEHNQINGGQFIPKDLIKQILDGSVNIVDMEDKQNTKVYVDQIVTVPINNRNEKFILGTTKYLSQDEKGNEFEKKEKFCSYLQWISVNLNE